MRSNLHTTVQYGQNQAKQAEQAEPNDRAFSLARYFLNSLIVCTYMYSMYNTVQYSMYVLYIQRDEMRGDIPMYIPRMIRYDN